MRDRPKKEPFTGVTVTITITVVRPHLYGLGYPRQPSPPPPPIYPGRGNFSLISLKNSTNRLRENRELISGDETTRVGELSRLDRSDGTTFSHINTSARLPETRRLKLFSGPCDLGQRRPNVQNKQRPKRNGSGPVAWSNR